MWKNYSLVIRRDLVDWPGLEVAALGLAKQRFVLVDVANDLSVAPNAPSQLSVPQRNLSGKHRILQQ